MTHFNNTVSIELQTKMSEFAENVNDDFISEFRDCCGCSNIATIDGIEYSGYIPLQKGGFLISEFYSNELDSTYHFTKNQTTFNAKIYESFLNDYKRENSLDEIDYDDEMFQNLENDFFDPCAFEFRIWIDNSDMVQIDVSVNYKDAPYYRFKSSENIIEKSMTIDDFMELDVAQFLIDLQVLVKAVKHLIHA